MTGQHNNFANPMNSSDNKRLAAHMREIGVSPSGEAWEIAKHAYTSGSSFQEAAEKARGGSYNERRALLSPPVRSPFRDGTKPRRGGGAADDPGDAAATPISAPRRSRPRTDGLGLPQIVWSPKKGGIGDIEAEGLQNLLGRSPLDRRTILVRETAQNSWDARLPGAPVVGFQFHLRSASDRDREVLRTLFPESIPGLGIGQALEQETLLLLEVSDRGTKGLGGPVRNDESVPAGTPTDYIDFLLRVGAPRNTSLGGGTYGFGKSISYTISDTGTMLVWTKCNTEEGIESRFLGSAIGKSYDKDGFHYTGRHWWGAETDGTTVPPLINAEADHLGELLFTCPFLPEQTGTSMLLIAPTLDDGESAQQYAQKLADGILWHLWPKLVPEPGRQRMDIRVFLDDEEIPIPAPEQHPVLKHFVRSLQSVRASQTGTQPPVAPMTTGFPVRGASRGRNANAHYGDGAITAFPSVREDELKGTPLQGGDRVNHVCWMRHDAELVVKYQREVESPHAEASWAGVFKPTSDADDAFAKSEPPTHDDWQPGAMPTGPEKSTVNIGLRRLSLAVTEVIQPVSTDARASEESVSVAGLGAELAGLVWGQHGNAPSQTPSQSQGRKAASRRPTARAISIVHGDIVDGWRNLSLEIAMDGPESSGFSVRPRVSIGTASPKGESDDSTFEIAGWDLEEPDWSAPPLSDEAHTMFVPNESCWLRLRVRDGLAFDVSMRVQQDG